MEEPDRRWAGRGPRNDGAREGGPCPYAADPVSSGKCIRAHFVHPEIKDFGDRSWSKYGTDDFATAKHTLLAVNSGLHSPQEWNMMQPSPRWFPSPRGANGKRKPPPRTVGEGSQQNLIF